MAEIHLRQDDPTNNRIVPHHYVYISCLIVRDAWRGKGIGRRLMDATELWARSHKANEVRLDCWEFAGGPLAFYESFGYQTLKRTLVKPL
jgi:GNAT superfamily N-acetyltransferase